MTDASVSQDLLAQAVGPSWDTYYRDRFAQIEAGHRIQWNWAGALVPFWCGWRRLPLSGALGLAEYFAAAFFAWNYGYFMAPMPAAMLGLCTSGLVGGLLQGAVGTWWVYRAAHGAARRSDTTGKPPVAPRRGPAPDLTHAFMSLVLLTLGTLAITIVVGHGHPGEDASPPVSASPPVPLSTLTRGEGEPTLPRLGYGEPDVAWRPRVRIAVALNRQASAILPCRDFGNASPPSPRSGEGDRG